MYNHLCVTIENVLQNQNVKWQFTISGFIQNLNLENKCELDANKLY